MDEDTNNDERLIEADFEIGHFIKEFIVPNATLYYTGDMVDEASYEEGDEEDEYDEDENEMVHVDTENSGLCDETEEENVCEKSKPILKTTKQNNKIKSNE